MTNMHRGGWQPQRMMANGLAITWHSNHSCNFCILRHTQAFIILMRSTKAFKMSVNLLPQTQHACPRFVALPWWLLALGADLSEAGPAVLHRALRCDAQRDQRPPPTPLLLFPPPTRPFRLTRRSFWPKPSTSVSFSLSPVRQNTGARLQCSRVGLQFFASCAPAGSNETQQLCAQSLAMPCRADQGEHGPGGGSCLTGPGLATLSKPVLVAERSWLPGALRCSPNALSLSCTA